MLPVALRFLHHRQRLPGRGFLCPLKPRVIWGGSHYIFLPRNRGYGSGEPAPKVSSPWQKSLKITGWIILSALGVYYVSHLEKVPETGRWRFMSTSTNFEAEFAELAKKEYRTKFQDATLPSTHPLSRHVLRVASRILSASNLGVVSVASANSVSMLPFAQGRDGGGYRSNSSANDIGSTVTWDVVVVNNPKIINALATPGLIVVFTGILPLCRDEDGLAAVLAHEIAHVVARHTAERISSQSPILLFQSLLQLVRPTSSSFEEVSQKRLQIRNSQVQEHEADIIGLRLMSKACYNPQSALDMLSRMAHLESKIPSNRNFTFTHPSSESRVKALEEALPKGYAIMAANPDCSHVRQQLEKFNDTVHAIDITAMI